MVGELSTALTGAKHEQEYMEVRERIHRASECPECSVLPALASACMCVIRKFIRRASECPDCSVLLAVASVCMCVVSSSTEPVGVLAVM